MKKLLFIGILACISGFSGCSSGPTTPSQTVFAAKQNYAVALSVAVAYKKLPVCPTASKICHDPKVLDQLRKIDDASAALLDGAENTVRSGATGVDLAVKAATEAVAAFTTITKTLVVK